MANLFKTNESGQIILLYESAEEGKCWFNMTTHKRHLYKQGDLKKGKVYEAEDLNQIRKIRDYLPETLDFGWITPEGDFWGCRCENHDAVLEMFFNLDRFDAEQKGWIHLYPGGWYINREIRLTDAQAKTLVDIGRHRLDNKIHNREVEFRNAFPEGYPFALLPCGFFTLHQPETGRRKAALSTVQLQAPAL